MSAEPMFMDDLAEDAPDVLPPSSTKPLIDRLRRHYVQGAAPGSGGLFADEIGVNGAFGQSQRCDALYAGFTSTSGRILIGHEVKVSRADWNHELDQAGKADHWHDACHEWWVVAPSTAIVDPATIPAGWGLMVPSRRSPVRFDRVVPATRRDFDPPWWAVRSFMARIDTLNSRLVHETVNGRVNTEVAAAKKSWEASATGNMTPETRRAVSLVQYWAESGVDLHDYDLDPKRVAELLPLIKAHDRASDVLDSLSHHWGGVDAVVERAADLHRAVKAVLAARDGLRQGGTP